MGITNASGTLTFCFEGTDTVTDRNHGFTPDERTEAAIGIQVAWGEPLRNADANIDLQVRPGYNNCQSGDVKIVRDESRDESNRAQALPTATGQGAEIHVPTTFRLGGEGGYSEGQWMWMVGHETGHVVDYDDAYRGLNILPPSCQDLTIMGDSWNWTGSKCGDAAAIARDYQGQGEPPPCLDCGTVSCYTPDWGGLYLCDYSDYFDGTCCLRLTSPLILDLGGHGIAMSGIEDGVAFDLKADGHPLRVGWPLSADDAWLAYDRNRNGRIDDGSELFGTATHTPAGHAENGFEALRTLDSNGDGVINTKDDLFSDLVVWRDLNRNGVTDDGELASLSASGISEIRLEYWLSQKKDRWGNRFRYRSRFLTNGRPAWHDIFDVYPVASELSETPIPPSLSPRSCSSRLPRR